MANILTLPKQNSNKVKNRALAAIEETLAANETILNLRKGETSVPGIHRESFPVDENLLPVDKRQVTEAVFNQALNKLIAEAGGQVSISSGKRSKERQTQLWNEALQKYGTPEKARKWVAPPGFSKHEKGIAADLRYASNAVRDWVHQNAKRFGLHFPLANEPWHLELIGSR